jgi:hypothetical protein
VPFSQHPISHPLCNGLRDASAKPSLIRVHNARPDYSLVALNFHKYLQPAQLWSVPATQGRVHTRVADVEAWARGQREFVVVPQRLPDDVCEDYGRA